jgi:hypothetical protein
MDPPDLKPAGMPIFDRWDTRLVQELAMLDEPEAMILERYGMRAEELALNPVLKQEVDALTTELRRTGQMAKVKARLVCEVLIGEAFRRARASLTLTDVLDTIRVLGKIGDLEPRNDGAKVTGTIVRVDLNIGQLGFAPAQAALTAMVVEQNMQEQDVQEVETTPAATGEPDIAGQLSDLFSGLPVEPLGDPMDVTP